TYVNHTLAMAAAAIGNGGTPYPSVHTATASATPTASTMPPGRRRPTRPCRYTQRQASAVISAVRDATDPGTPHGDIRKVTSPSGLNITFVIRSPRKIAGTETTSQTPATISSALAHQRDAIPA